MSVRADLFDLARLSLAPGEGRSLSLHAGLDPLELSGERYAAVAPLLPVELGIARMTSGGYSLRLRLEARLDGPCMRCLEPARPEVTVDAREVDRPGGGEELDSPYVTEGVLDLRAWVRDALALVLPAQVVCRPSCAGLCPECGENLNTAAPDHAHEREPDPRWAALRELRLD